MGRKIEVGVRGGENFMDSKALVFYKVWVKNNDQRKWDWEGKIL